MGDDEREFVDTISQRILETGTLPNVHAVRRILQREFNDPITVNPIRSHFAKVLEAGRVDPRG